MGVLKQAVRPSMHYNTNDGHNFIGAPSFATHNPAFYTFYKSEAFASIYHNVSRIAEEFMTIQPFAIDAEGERQNDVQVIRALYHPNQLDSSVAFFEKLAVSTLIHRKTYVLVWRKEGNEAVPGGVITPDNIAGFTFLERPGITRRDGRTYYNIGAQVFNDKEVIVIPGGVDPHNLYNGYSAGEASRRWATIDDYIADYQKGFFENGAVPSGQFVITAVSDQDFNDTVDRLQSHHRGAGNNNNVTYTPRPVDQNTGKPVDSKIEWIPFSSNNKELDLAGLFDQVNKRLDSDFGVPASIRGVGENNNYATARTDQQNFIRFTIAPLALRIYTQITHELNRITDGLGVAITYKIELPAIADEEKIQAETKLVIVRAIKELLTQQYDLDSIVDALELPQSYKKLALPATEEVTEDNIDDDSEVADSPNPAKIDGITPINKVTDQLPEPDVESYEARLAQIVRDHMSKQIERFIDSLEVSDAKGDPDESESEDFTDDMMTVIVATMIASGEIQYPEGITLLVDAGVSTDNLKGFVLSEAQRKEYRDYLIDVARSYGDDTGQSIRNVLARGNVEQWDRNRLESELRNIMNTDEWRVARLATSEINRSQDMGSIYSMKQIQDEADVSVERSLLHTGSDSPCEYCRAYIDNWMPLDEPMINKDELIEGVDGGLLVYTWDINQGHDVHANGHCVPQYRIA